MSIDWRCFCRRRRRRCALHRYSVCGQQQQVFLTHTAAAARRATARRIPRTESERKRNNRTDRATAERESGLQVNKETGKTVNCFFSGARAPAIVFRIPWPPEFNHVSVGQFRDPAIFSRFQAGSSALLLLCAASAQQRPPRRSSAEGWPAIIGERPGRQAGRSSNPLLRSLQESTIVGRRRQRARSVCLQGALAAGGREQFKALLAQAARQPSKRCQRKRKESSEKRRRERERDAKVRESTINMTSEGAQKWEE